MSNHNHSPSTPGKESSYDANTKIKTPLVLVIEDNPDNMKLFQWLLDDLEYNYEGCATGEEGMAWLASNKPDLLLLDISLPGIDGKEVARRLRNQESFTSLPIIAVTAHAIKQENDEIMSSGVNLVVTKPVDEDYLLHVIRSYIEGIEIHTKCESS